MEAASLAIASDPSGLDQLRIDVKNKPLEPRALQQHAVLAFGRRTNAQPPLPVLLQDAVALVGEVLDAQLGGVGEVRGDNLVLTVAPRDDQGRGPAPREHRCGVADTHSMAAFALRSGNVTAAADLRQEPRFRDDFLRGRDVVGALTVPLHVNGKPFGVLGVYTKAPRQFSLDEVTFAETIAHLLSASVARIKAEEKLQEAHEIKSSLLGMVDSMVMTLDMEGRVVDMNRACEELTKYRLEDVRHQPFWQAMVAPDDADLVKIIFQSSRGSQIPSEFEGEVLARDGSRRRVSWSLKVLSTGQVQTILVTGRDQTAQAEIKAELQRMKSLAEETTATLSQLTARLDKRRTTTAGQAAPRELDEELEGPPGPVETGPPAADHGYMVPATEADQRRSPRRAYRYRQDIAPMNDRQLPGRDGFFEVEFWDISACGFSFFMDQLPKFETLVAALGRPPAINHFSARVMRVARMKQDNATRYLVGCDFINRVHLPKTRV
jgi:PAS domain S-box-containing protein